MLKRILFTAVILGSLVFSFTAMKSYYSIDPIKCTNCGECLLECPEDAISIAIVDGKEVHIIDPIKCTDCGICVEFCPEMAIYQDTGDVAE